MPYEPTNALRIADAARGGKVEGVRRLLIPAEINEPISFVGGDYILLHQAATDAHLDLCRFLLENGADPNVLQPTHGFSPLLCVFERLFVTKDRQRIFDCAKVLLDGGADPNLSDKLNGMTPLHRALRGGSFFLQKVEEGRLDLTEAQEDVSRMCRLLIERGADPNLVPATGVPEVRSKEYLTPFQFAVKKGLAAEVRFMIEECGVDPAQRSLGGKTMVQLAGKSQEVKEILRSSKIVMGVEKAIDSVGIASKVKQSKSISPL